jgi:hypothetical protein
MDRCVNPDAAIELCVVCGAKIRTCERKKPINNDYRCPVHPDGCKLQRGGWVCSDKCWDKAVEEKEWR